MPNLTIVIDEDTLKQARLRAAEDGLSINAVIREQLKHYAGGRERREEAVERILKAAKEAGSGSGRQGRHWKREDLYEE